MPTTGQFAQRDPRLSVPLELDGRVEFRYPNPNGRRISAPVLDLSVAGLSFSVDHELPLVVRGARIGGVVVRVGDRAIEGKLLVMHCSREHPGHVVYGGVFYPSTERDQSELNAVLAALAQLA